MKRRHGKSKLGQLTQEDWAIVFWRNEWWVGMLMRAADHSEAEAMLTATRSTRRRGAQ